MRDSDEKYPWLSEFICEYVDDTMDPDARAMFEEYLAADPSLYQYVCSLKNTRKMLQHHGCKLHAPCSLQQQLRARIALEQEIEPPTSLPTTESSATPLFLMALIVVSLLGSGVLLSGSSPVTAPQHSVVTEPTWSPVLAYPEVRAPRPPAQLQVTSVAFTDSVSRALFPRFSGEP